MKAIKIIIEGFLYLCATFSIASLSVISLAWRLNVTLYPNPTILLIMSFLGLLGVSIAVAHRLTTGLQEREK